MAEELKAKAICTTPAGSSLRSDLEDAKAKGKILDDTLIMRLCHKHNISVVTGNMADLQMTADMGSDCGLIGNVTCTSGRGGNNY